MQTYTSHLKASVSDELQEVIGIKPPESTSEVLRVKFNNDLETQSDNESSANGASLRVNVDFSTIPAANAILLTKS